MTDKCPMCGADQYTGWGELSRFNCGTEIRGGSVFQSKDCEILELEKEKQELIVRHKRLVEAAMKAVENRGCPDASNDGRCNCSICELRKVVKE